jgi:tRNA1Val (adenine37-N6)-methyltransferase
MPTEIQGPGRNLMLMKNPDDYNEKINALVHKGERVDDLQRNGLLIIQDPSLFCFGVDAVLLSSFIKTRPGASVCDLCTGNGIIPILISDKTDCGHIDAVELQDKSYDLARRSVELNGLSDRINIIHGDVNDMPQTLGRSCYDVITVNPPYMKESSGLNNMSEARNIARHEIFLSLDECVSAAAALLKPNGHLFMVHRPARLTDLVLSMNEHGLEPKRLRLVTPYVGKSPNLLLMEAVKNGGRELKIEPVLYMYNEDGSYTDELKEFYGMQPSDS